MAYLSQLRDNLRGDLSDVAQLAPDRRLLENEYLERALFDGLQQHNRSYTWASLPPAEDQLILLLAKARIALDFSLAYALDPKLAIQTVSRDKLGNAQILQNMVVALRNEYETVKGLVTGDPDDGGIVEGTLVKTDWMTRVKMPTQAASRPQKPFITLAEYLYSSTPQPDGTLGGRIHLQWNRLYDTDLAFLQILVSRQKPVLITDKVIRTLYDVWIDPLAIPSVPPLAQQESYIAYNLVPTGRWYIALAAFNWNRLTTLSDSVPLDVANYLDLPADTYVVAA